MAKLLKWRGKQIAARPARILGAYGPVISEELQRQIATVQFQWPNPTLRFTSLFMGGTPQKNRTLQNDPNNRRSGYRVQRNAKGPFSPPTTEAGASNTMAFKARARKGKPSGRGIIISEGPRDAVDTGNLLRSQSAPEITVVNGKATFSILWTAKYSGVVLRGGDYGSYINVNGANVKVGQRPGRDWITPALQQQPLRPFFYRQWRQLAGR